jgi:hypothetical protein
MSYTSHTLKYLADELESRKIHHETSANVLKITDASLNDVVVTLGSDGSLTFADSEDKYRQVPRQQLDHLYEVLTLLMERAVPATAV